ncbi:unnamed protein product [Spirodela intermedia]|uniref:Uncharacterized protein n=1 Tax=Spirodela intermedia TaxID=51605 RepID=A0A7I8J368_SPIIN|nr:unnamed protein product [Spirodela intermedia]CAA6664698.1 unnamed protein product [Spirodela intermedia]
MPGLVHKSSQLGNAAAAAAAALCLPSAAAIGPTSSNGIWSKHRDDISFDQLQKFWNDLPPHSRRNLLRIDKQTLFEQARKNLYCSRCNGLLLEGFSQLVLYGKSLQQDGGGINPSNRTGAEKSHICQESDDLQDPSLHPWGGLVGTRDGMLTLSDSFIDGNSLRPLQNVFDSARARERERELLYPDACGGGGRGWISQGVAIYGRGHGTRETCALHTARLSCDTLVDFWSALGDETRLSLLRMKEEDFIERLMFRFDSKRFCRDCRRNVIREFKELKELKRMRKEPRCTSWFCVADTSFQYEVSDGTVQVDWHQSFKETPGIYHHFEWAIGTAEGKSDILDFEDVGMKGKVQVHGLDLSGLSACFITLRAWRLDGRCTELTVKAHGLKGQPCVHRRLVVGDGYVTITKGENIRRFFEHAEEVEEEEDDDSIDKDGSDLDGDGSRPQKHAKSPELAREFLLDAATVIFKEQVEKAFREGTARQNAHSTFVCLALKLLEERVHVACKEIVTLKNRLLEEEEREKREEEERKERRRAKEREKKLRRKERLKVKEMEREIKNTESKSLPPALLSTSSNELCRSNVNEAPITLDSEDSVGDTGDLILYSPSAYANSEVDARDDADSFILEQPKSSSRKLRFKSSPPETAHRRPHTMASCDDREKISNGHALTSSRFMNGKHRQFSANGSKPNPRDGGSKFSDKLHSNGRVHDRCDFHSCACGHNGDYRAKEGHYIPTIRSGREVKIVNKTEAFEPVAPPHRIAKYGHGCFALDSFPSSAGSVPAGVGHLRRGKIHQMKQVWEPADPRKKCSRGHSDHDGSSQPAAEARSEAAENGCEKKAPTAVLQEPGDCCYFDVPMDSDKPEALGGSHQCQEAAKSHYYSKDAAGDEEANSDPLTASSSSDNCSSCLSEGGDSTTTSSSAHNAESSSISDSEDPAGQPLELRQDPPADANGLASGGCKASSFPREDPPVYGEFPRRRHLLPLHSPPQLHVPVFPMPAVGFHTQSPAAAWAAPVPANRLVPLPQPHQFMFPHPLGYGLAANPPPDFCNALPQPAAPLLHPGHFPSFKAVHSGPLNEPQQLTGGKEEPAKSPSFSLFHFGGPMAMAPEVEGPGEGGGGAAIGPAERRSELDCSRTEAEVEYSLFSSTNGVRFSFLR